MRLDKALPAYEIDLQSERKPPATIRWYRRKPKYFAPWIV
jgi:hypothetical protein